MCGKMLLGYAIFLVCLSSSSGRRPQSFSQRKEKMRKLESFTTHNSPIRRERSAGGVAGHVLEQNYNLIPGSMSRIHHVPGRFRLARRPASPEKPYQVHQVKMEESHGEKRVKRDQGPQENYLLYAISKNSRTEIHKINLEDNSDTTMISHSQFGDFAGLDYYYKQNRLYWADSVIIYCTSLTGSGVEIVHNNLPAVKGIAVDWLGDNIFWTDASGIKVSKTDGRFIKTLISHPDYTGIVLDPERGHMYWIHWGVASANLMSAHMWHGEGDSLKQIQVLEPRGMAIDFSEQLPYRRFYYVESFDNPSILGAVNKVNFQMTGIALSYRKRLLPHPYAIFVFQDILYYSEWSTDSILKFNLSNYDQITSGPKPQTLRSHASYALDIKIVHKDIQRGHNLCSQLRPCTHLCLADTNRRYQCACPDNTKTLKQPSGNVSCLCKGKGCKHDLPSSAPSKSMTAAYPMFSSSTPTQRSSFISPSIPMRYSKLLSSSVPSPSSKGISSSIASQHPLQLPSSSVPSPSSIAIPFSTVSLHPVQLSSSSPLLSTKLLLPSSSWWPSKLSSSSPHSSGIHFLSTSLQSSPSSNLERQSSEILKPSTSLTRSHVSPSDSPRHSTDPSGQTSNTLEPTANARNAQENTSKRPYWAIGVALAGVIHVLVGAYIIRKKLWKKERRQQASVVYDETQSRQDVPLPQLEQNLPEGQP